MPEGVLIAGQTCWRIEPADRVACIVDGADYFRHVKAAMLRARHRIMLIGWDFDTRILFERGGKTLPGPNQLGTFLRWMARMRPDLDIRLLRSNVRLVSAMEGMWGTVTPVSWMNRLTRDRIRFAVDGVHPLGAVPHQKIVVIDDAVAFCGGIDLAVGRWDTREHQQVNRFRSLLGQEYGPRHDVVMAVEGAAARALGEHARDRWQSATGESLEPVHAAHVVWPVGLEPTMRGVDVGIARTRPELGGRPEVREVEALNLAAIASARTSIYLENQYLASRTLIEALARRLGEVDGPQVVIVIPRHSESRLEEQSMDSARYRMLRILWAADVHQRLGVYWPVTSGRRDPRVDDPEGSVSVYVHSKVLVIDDRLLRIGSSNLNNRSMGFDSECDLAVETHPSIGPFRDGLLAEHLGVAVDEFADAVDSEGSLLAAVEALRGSGRSLQPFTAATVAGEASLLAENDLMDPDRVPQSVARSMRRWVSRMLD